MRLLLHSRPERLEICHSRLHAESPVNVAAESRVPGDTRRLLQVLKVEQAAVLLSITHPHHPDCLALANLMAQTRRNVTSGTDTRT